MSGKMDGVNIKNVVSEYDSGIRVDAGFAMRNKKDTLYGVDFERLKMMGENAVSKFFIDFFNRDDIGRWRSHIE